MQDGLVMNEKEKKEQQSEEKREAREGDRKV